MWTMIASLDVLVQALAPAFTKPSFVTHCEFFLGWILCLGKHRLCRVAASTQPQILRDQTRRHGLDVFGGLRLRQYIAVIENDRLRSDSHTPMVTVLNAHSRREQRHSDCREV